MQDRHIINTDMVTNNEAYGEEEVQEVWRLKSKQRRRCQESLKTWNKKCLKEKLTNSDLCRCSLKWLQWLQASLCCKSQPVRQASSMFREHLEIIQEGWCLERGREVDRRWLLRVGGMRAEHKTSASLCLKNRNGNTMKESRVSNTGNGLRCPILTAAYPATSDSSEFSRITEQSELRNKIAVCLETKYRRALKIILNKYLKC